MAKPNLRIVAPHQAEPASGPTTESYVGELAPKIGAATDTVAEAVLSALVANGIEVGFGIPGGPIASLFVAATTRPDFALVESRTENAAGFAAASYFRSSAKPAALLITAGPGVTNAVTGIASASCERVPLIVICGDVAWAAGRRLLQDSGPNGLDAEQILDSVTRHSVRIQSAESAISDVNRAVHLATASERPGPVLIVLPTEHGHAAISRVPVITPMSSRERARPAPVHVEQVAAKLAAAERPLIVLGAGARASAVSVRRLVDAFNIPFVTTPQAKGIVSEEHPRSLRHGGLAASMWAREYTRSGVDAALVLGTDLDDCSIGGTPYVEDGWLAHVDLDAGVFNRNLPTQLGICCDVGNLAEDLANTVMIEGLVNPNVRSLLRAVKRSPPQENLAQVANTIASHTAVTELQTAFPDAKFITDIGEHMLIALHYFVARHPEHFHIHLGLGSMGSGIAGAIGLAIAEPDQRIVCICGDGSMQMTGMELLVAQRRQLPITFAVFNDARYNMVHHGTRTLYGTEVSGETRMVDFVGWARSIGVPGARVTRPGTIGDMESRLRSPGPMLLDIRVDPEVRLPSSGRIEALARMSRGHDEG